MANLIIETINALQAIHQDIADIEYAPTLTDGYPNSLDTMRMPALLTEVFNQSLLDMRPHIKRADLILQVTYYQQPIGQGFFEVEKTRLYEALDAYRNKFLAADTYVNSDISGGIILCDSDNNLKSWINTAEPWKTTGYTMVEYPELPGTTYDLAFLAHGWKVWLAVTAVNRETLC